MEFEFALQGLQGDGISVWDAARLAKLNSVDFHKLRNVLEEFGQRSAVAQDLSSPITDIWRLRSSDQRLYLQTASAALGSCILLGGLKIGKKKLFIHRANGAIAEVEPLCVLDVYVHESCQRQGVGKALFEYMLEAEQTTPEQLAYDRPSPKLLSFLKKHYMLCSFVPQSNNFVIFEQYFQACAAGATMGGRSLRSSTCTTSNSPSGSCDGAVPPFLLTNLGNGRQNVHVIGTAAAAGLEGPADKRWLTTSFRPPTPSLQHSVQRHPADLHSDSLNATSASPTAALPLTLGGPGCTPAGVPTHRPDKHQASPLAQQGPQIEVQYARGAGFKSLDRGHAGGTPGGADDVHTFKGYQQALLAAANKPAPPLLSGMSPGLRDSLDNFTVGINQQQQQQQYGGSSSGGGGISARHSGGDGSREPPWAGGTEADSSNTGLKGRSQATGSYQAGDTTQCGVKKDFLLTTPYSSWEPQPGSLLPACSSDADRMSLRRQEEQQLQLRLQQQQKRWQAMGAGPPGHLLAAPTSSYAVPTVGMADVIRNGLQQQQQQQPPSDILSWDGLPVNLLKQLKQQQPQQQCSRQGSSSNGRRTGGGDGVHYGQRVMQPGDIRGSSSSSRQGSRGHSGGGMCQAGTEVWQNAKTAAASHRAGTGAASCLRMV